MELKNRTTVELLANSKEVLTELLGRLEQYKFSEQNFKDELATRQKKLASVNDEILAIEQQIISKKAEGETFLASQVADLEAKKRDFQINQVAFYREKDEFKKAQQKLDSDRYMFDSQVKETIGELKSDKVAENKPERYKK